MQRGWYSLALTAALVLGAAACERPGDGPATSESIAGPHAALVASNAYRTSSGYTLLLGAANTSVQSRAAVLGYNGGKLNIGANQLVVPVGAVSEPVRFTITVRSQPYLAAQLTAVKMSDGSLLTQFPVTLGLKLSYAKSPTPIADATRLEVFYVRDGEVLGTQPTIVDVKGQTVYAELTHFSEYSPGLDP